MTTQYTRFGRYIVYISVILLAFALRIYGLDTKELSADEAYGVMMIQQPFADLWRTGQDLHPPLYHALEWIVTRFAGESAFVLRFAALIPGVLTVAFAISIGRRVAGWGVGWISGGLVAISPALVYWSQDARLYTLLAATTAASMDAFLQLNTNTQRQGAKAQRRKENVAQPPFFAPFAPWRLGVNPFAFYLFATLAAMYTQYGAFWVIAAQNGVVILSIIAPKRFPAWASRDGYRRWVIWFAGQILLAIAYLPWVIGQASFVLSPSTLRADGFAFSISGLIDAMRQIVVFWFGGYTDSPRVGYAVGVGLATVLLALLLAAPLSKRRLRTTLYTTMALWIVCSFAVVTLTAQAMDYFDPRFAVAAIVPLCVLIAVVIDFFFQKKQRILMLIIVLPILLESVTANLDWYNAPPTAKGDYRQVMARIESQSQDGDLILFNNPGQIALQFVHAPDAIPGVLLDIERVNRSGTNEYLADVVGDARRVWLVEYGDPAGFDSMRLVPDYLASRGLRTLAFDYSSGSVALYDLRGVDAEWQPIDARFGDAIRLESYRIVVDADSVRLSLMWAADGTPTADYHVGCHILNEAGVLIGQTDALPRGGAARTVDWRAGDRIEDSYAIPLPTDLPSGTYTVAVVLYTFPELQRAPVSGANAAGDMVVLTTFAHAGS